MDSSILGLKGDFKLSSILIVENGIPLKRRILSAKIFNFDKEIVEKYSILERNDIGVWEFGLFEFKFPTWSNYMFSRIKQIRKTGWSFGRTVHLLSFVEKLKDFQFEKDILALGERKIKSFPHKTISFTKEENKKVLRIFDTEEMGAGYYYYLLVRKTDLKPL